MAYSSQSDLEIAAGGLQRLIALSDFAGTQAVNANVIARAIADADAWINSWVSKKYQVPVSPVPPDLVRLSSSEAIFLLKQWRSMAAETDVQLHEERERELKDISAGLRTLGVLPQPLRSDLVRDRASAPADDKPVSRDALKGFS
jgi:phage gp36-like protein